MRPIHTILFATDFSTAAEQARLVACALARAQDARLLVLHVVPRARPVREGGTLSTLPQAEVWHQDLLNYQQEMLDRLHRFPLPGLQLRAERLLREGSPAEVILDTARETNCDVLVLGTHGRTGETRQVMGSVAEEVARKAPCPVVTVKAPATEPEPAAELTPEEAGLIL